MKTFMQEDAEQAFAKWAKGQDVNMLFIFEEEQGCIVVYTAENKLYILRMFRANWKHAWVISQDECFHLEGLAAH